MSFVPGRLFHSVVVVGAALAGGCSKNGADGAAPPPNPTDGRSPDEIRVAPVAPVATAIESATASPSAAPPPVADPPKDVNATDTEITLRPAPSAKPQPQQPPRLLPDGGPSPCPPDAERLFPPCYYIK